MLERLKAWARSLKRDVLAIYMAARDGRLHWGVKLFALALVAYALSPIDLIPDFIPVIGYLDDLILLPLGIWMLLRLIPEDVLSECRKQAETRIAEGTDISRWGAAIVVLLWVACGLLVWRMV